MKNPRSAMISCNDGFRPVNFLLEALDEKQRNEGYDGKSCMAGWQTPLFLGQSEE